MLWTPKEDLSENIFFQAATKDLQVSKKGMAGPAWPRRHSYAVAGGWLQVLAIVLTAVLWSVLWTGNKFAFLVSAENVVLAQEQHFHGQPVTSSPLQPQPSVTLQELVMSGSGSSEPDDLYAAAGENVTDSGQRQSLSARLVQDYWPNLPALSDFSVQQEVTRLVNLTLSNALSQPLGKNLCFPLLFFRTDICTLTLYFF